MASVPLAGLKIRSDLEEALVDVSHTVLTDTALADLVR
jgi:hypothetical protein